MRVIKLLVSILTAAAVLISCKDDDPGVGLTIQPDEDLYNTYSGVVPVSTSLMRTDSVLSKSQYLYLGRYTDPKFGAILAEFITEIDSRIEGLELPDTSISNSASVNGISSDILTSIDERYGKITCIRNGRDIKLDSAFFYFTYSNSIVGDTMTIQQISLYTLSKKLPQDNQLYSNINPNDYCDKSEMIGACTFAPQRKRTVKIPLNEDFAQDFLNTYLNGEITTEKDFQEKYKGFYLSNTFNEGAVLQIVSSGIQICYSFDADIETTFDDRDTVITGRSIEVNGRKINPLVSSFIIAANEAVQNVNIFRHPDFDERLESLDTINFNYCYTPAGMYVKVEIDFDDIVKDVEDRGEDRNLTMFNSCRLRIGAKNIDWITKYNESPNTYMLLIDRDKVTDFFYNNRYPDSKTSFVASFDTASSQYSFDVTRAAQLRMKNDDKSILSDMVIVPVYGISVGKGLYYRQQLHPTITRLISSKSTDESAVSPKLEYVFSRRQ